jgi:hypothetical protein
MGKDKEVLIQQGTYGLLFTLSTGIDLTATTGLLLKITKPSGVTIEVTLANNALNITNAIAGKVTYVVQENDLDVPGRYTIQIIETSGRYLPSVPQKFKVVANL